MNVEEVILGSVMGLKEGNMKCEVNLKLFRLRCCIRNCSTNGLSEQMLSQISYVPFPKDPSRFAEWLRVIGRKDLLSVFGKRQNSNVLLCSRHFSRNMWISLNSRMRRLHKNAVPDINLSGKNESKLRKMAMSEKIRQLKSVSSTITPIRRLISPVIKVEIEDDEEVLPAPVPLKPVKKIVSTPPHAKSTGKSDSEKKLLAENNELKSELDKNMDYITSQKTHYETLLSKERLKAHVAENRFKTLQDGHQKLFHAYESQIEALKTVAQSKNFELNDEGFKIQQQDLEIKLTAANQRIVELFKENEILKSEKERVEPRVSSVANSSCVINTEDSLSEDQSTRQELEMKLVISEERIEELTSSNQSLKSDKEKLQAMISDHLDRKFTGERFKSNLENLMLKEKQVKEKIALILDPLHAQAKQSPNTKKTSIMEAASNYLTSTQLSILAAMLKPRDLSKDMEERYMELSLSLYETSPDAYLILSRALGLATNDQMKRWKLEMSTNGVYNISCTLNALCEKLTQADSNPMKKTITLNKKRKASDLEEHTHDSIPSKKKLIHSEAIFEADEDDFEEGKVSDADEKITFTDTDEYPPPSSIHPPFVIQFDTGNPNNIKQNSGTGILHQVNSSNKIVGQRPTDMIYIKGRSQVDRSVMKTQSPSSSELDDEEDEFSDIPLLAAESLTSLATSGMPPSSFQPEIPSKVAVSRNTKVISSDPSLSKSSKVVYKIIES